MDGLWCLGLGESGFKKLDKHKLAEPVNSTCQYRCQEQPVYYLVF